MDSSDQKSIEGSQNQPISHSRLEEIATNACDTIFQFVDSYEHSRTEAWNNSIINSVLKSLIAEASTPTQTPVHKFAVTSTIIQHTTPPLSRPPPDEAAAANGADQQGNSIGRRGMHSASGAYWNTEKDGMWNWKYTKGEDKGFDVVLSIMWISIV
ncbi:MAG: hypothetical protein Q9183_001522 [Haloplaca sp. 2 TL-2023]